METVASSMSILSSFLAGDPKKTLQDNQSIAISKELADLLFNNQDVLGKTILLDHKTEFKVSAVYSQIFPGIAALVTSSLFYLLMRSSVRMMNG